MIQTIQTVAENLPMSMISVSCWIWYMCGLLCYIACKCTHFGVMHVLTLLLVPGVVSGRSSSLVGEV